MGRSVCWGENTFTPSCLCFTCVPCVECLFCTLGKAQDCRGPWELDWGPAGELLVELPWVQSRQKSACPCPGLETPSQKMFSIIWRKLKREISTSFSLKPFTPMLYLFLWRHKGMLFFFPDIVFHSRLRRFINLDELEKKVLKMLVTIGLL